jgi:hypothetical protein
MQRGVHVTGAVLQHRTTDVDTALQLPAQPPRGIRPQTRPWAVKRATRSPRR